MDLQSFVVTVHIVCVILWVGGGMALLLGAEMARRKHGDAGALPIVDVVALMGPVYFVPVSLLTVLSGAAAAWFGPGFGELWIILGLVGFAVTFLTGLLVIKPRAEAIAALASDGQADQGRLLAKSLDLLTIARFDYVVLVLVVLVMVLKPAANDTVLLAGLAVVATVGAMFTLVKGMRSQGAQA